MKAAFETHIDDEALATGTHQGANGAGVLYVPDGSTKNFVPCHHIDEVK